MALILDLFRFPSVGRGIFFVFERNLLLFRYHLLTNFLVMVVEPLVFFCCLAYGIGYYVGPVNGMEYVEYLVPGVMLATAMIIAYTECSHNCYLKINPSGHYANYLYTPLAMSEIAIGEVFWGAFKGMLGGASIVVFAVSQGFIQTDDFASCLAILFVTSLMFSALGLLVMTVAKSHDTFNFAQVLFILPMYMLSGALFPLDALPAQYSSVSLMFPLTHAILFLRSALIDIQDTQFFLHFAIVFVTALGLLNLSVSRFQRRFRR